MHRLGRVMRSRSGVSVTVLMATVAILVSGGPAAGAERGRTTLALGDSVPFGYITQAGYQYVNPNNFIGFPEHAGQQLHSEVTNASCPGETSGSLLTGVDDNGCMAFRAKAPLHVSYLRTQIKFATSFLQHHPETRLVTILIGANDGFLLQKTCAFDPVCIQAGLPALLIKLGQNLDATFQAIHHAGFHGVLVGVTYYSLNYSDRNGTFLVQELNDVITQHTLAAGGVIADGFAAFKTAATPAGGDSCHAGLLNATPDPLHQFTCDVHPSQSGQELLVRTVVDAYQGAQKGDN
jgi:GDSL-like Lipase/Acylhydrolase family